MKTKQEIEERITELKKSKSENDYEVCYLKTALIKDELTILNLYCKYKLEMEECQDIVKALSWVLEK